MMEQTENVNARFGGWQTALGMKSQLKSQKCEQYVVCHH